MNINRHNYEEYFILYLDNELGPEERRQVDDFIALHPDLKEELESLLQYKLIPDTSLVFPAKEELWKGENSIHSGNYNEWLLLYVDNELTATERLLVEEFANDNDAACKELALLMKTRITADIVVFKDKASLYRRDERKIPIIWFRIAAAIIIAALGITAFYFINRNNDAVTPSIANMDKGLQKDNKARNAVVVKNNNNEATLKNDAITVKGDNDPIPAEQTREKKSLPSFRNSNIAVNDGKKIKEVQPIVKKEEPIAINDTRKDNNLPKPVNNPVLKVEDKAIASNEITSLKENNNLLKNNTDVTSRTDQPSDIRTAVYDPNNESFADNGKDSKKNKLRGFFRKVSRTFEKRTNIEATDDDKLLVAGFSIKLK